MFESGGSTAMPSLLSLPADVLSLVIRYLPNEDKKSLRHGSVRQRDIGSTYSGSRSKARMYISLKTAVEDHP
jgi:hypothetical protein